MSNYHKQKTDVITTDERNTLIANLLLLDTNKGKLHQPKDAYFNGVIGLNHLASDIVTWLGFQVVSIDVITTKDASWSAHSTESTKEIRIPEAIISQHPFLALYYTCLAVCSLLTDEHITDTSLSCSAKQELMEHFSIEAGLGIYGMNALYDTDVHNTTETSNQVLEFIAPGHYKQLFAAYCNNNNIAFTSYEQGLLPAAQDALQLHSPKSKRKSFVRRYLQKHKTNKERFALTMLSMVFLATFLFMLWPYIPKPLNQDQRAMQSEIISLKQRYDDCQSVLTQMHESIIEPDILSSRSLQKQSQVCSSLKQEHDKLVNRYNRSL